MEITDHDLCEFRERAKTELKSGHDCGRMRWDDVVEALCKEVKRLRSESSTINADSAAMREELEKILSEAQEIASAPSDQYPAVASGLAQFVCRHAKAALALPRRNCDEGTTAWAQMPCGEEGAI